MALPDYLQDTAKDFAKQLTATTSVPIDTTKFTGRQFVAGEDPLQTQAIGIAQQGVGSYQPFLTAAQQAGVSGATTLGTAATTLGGAQPNITTAQGLAPTTGAAATTLAQDFMSPFQQQVIDTTLAEFDRNRAIQEQRIRDQQAQLGVLGAGRAGVQLAELGTGLARERALLQAGLLQQGFGQAQAARQQDIANQFNLASAQQGLGGFQANLGQAQQGATGTDISRLGSLGALNQAQAQAQLDATREATRQAAFQPQEELNRFADITTGIMGGMRGSGTQTANVPNPTPLQSALGIGSTLAGIYGYLGGRPFA